MDEPFQKQTKKKSKRFLFIPIVVLIIAVGVAIAWSIGNRQNTPIDDQDDWKVVEDEESQKAETEIASEIETENIPMEEETQEKPQEVIGDESEQAEILEIRMRDVKDVSASSYFSEKNIKYVPDRIMDGDTTIAWVEGVEGNGEGESITFTFGDLYVVSDIQIWNGYQKSEDTVISEIELR